MPPPAEVETAPSRARGSALGKRPAERQGAPGDDEDGNEQVHAAPAVMHARAPCHSTCTCTCTQFLVPIRTGAVCSGAERQCPLAKKMLPRATATTSRAPSRNRKQPRAAESSREQPRAAESKREHAPLARLAPLAYAYHFLHFPTKPLPRDTG
jgi:hypothetical protein